jgi:hypothetical protein
MCGAGRGLCMDRLARPVVPKNTPAILELQNLLIRILSAFRTVATATLEVEAHVLPPHLRHRAQRTIARVHTLPRLYNWAYNWKSSTACFGWSWESFDS